MTAVYNEDEFYAELEKEGLLGDPAESTEKLNSSPDSAQPYGLADSVPPPEYELNTPALAAEENILDLFRKDVGKVGLAGEDKPACLIYLAVTSRLLSGKKATERPVSVIPKGTSSSGKSYMTRTVLDFFPDDAYVNLGSMSKRFLFYDEQPLSHRFIYIPEWSSIAKDEELVTLVRNLLSEGHITHGTVEGDGKRAARRIEKQGPTGLIVTTTNATVDAELETRCFSIVTDDSTEQTRRVYMSMADLENGVGSDVDLTPWQELQEWLELGGAREVSIPFVQELAEHMPAAATRLRRDFVSLISLVKAHALLHQATRGRDGFGRVIATVADYAAVRDLVGELIAEGVDASVTKATREIVEAVKALLDADEHLEYVTPKKIADKLGIGQPATYDRMHRAIRSGYLHNASKKDERGYKIGLGSPLPDGPAFLPDPGVFSSDSVGPPERISGSTMRKTEADSAIQHIQPNPRTEAPEKYASEAAGYAEKYDQPELGESA